MAQIIVDAVRKLDPSLIMLAPAHSALAQAAEAAGQPLRNEVFADRAYLDDGQLMPRSQPGAVLHDAQQCVEHVLRMIQAQGIVTAAGVCLPCRIDSICVHGDGKNAVQTAQNIRQSLQQAGYVLRPL